MWTEEKLETAAEEYFQGCFKDCRQGKREPPSLNEMFIAGCKYIINNTQKDETK